jgi:magnesium transporter
MRYIRDQDRFEELIGELPSDVPSGQGDPLWIDFGLPTPEEIDLLSRVFHFHPLAITDCFNLRHPPKAEQYNDTLFLIVYGPDVSSAKQRVGTKMLCSFLRGPVLVTVRLSSMVWVGEVQEQIRRTPGIFFRDGVVPVLYSIFERMVNQYLPLVDALNERVDQLEEDVLKDPPADFLQRVQELRQEILRLRRLLSPQRDVAAKLARGDFPQIAEAERYFFRNIYDHLNHVYEELDLQRDGVAGVRDAYLSVLSNRMNELGLETNQVMKVLTMVSMALLPMSLMAGIFGMNFDHLPWLHERWGVWLVMGLMAMLAGAVLGFYRWAGWLGHRSLAERSPDATCPRR